MPFGRPTKYHDDFPSMLLKYFGRDLTKIITKKVVVKDQVHEIEEEVANEFPTVEGFCWDHNICTATFYTWIKDEGKFDFLEAYKRAQDRQKQFIQSHGLMGRYDRTFSIFIGKAVCKMKDNPDASDEDKSLNIYL